MPKSFCSNAGLPGSFTNALSYDEQIQYLVNKYNEMADVINNLKIDADISDVVKYIPQTGFSELQKQQARNNIGAGTSNITSGDISTQIDNNSVKFSGSQNLTEDQKAQARNNIGAGTSNITSGDISKQIDNNSVKFSGVQNLTEDQKAQARANIGAGTGSVEGAVLYTPQTLTNSQKAQARENIGVETGTGSTVGAVLYTPQSLTDGQKAQARNNIGAGTSNITSGDISAQINNNSVKFSGAQNLTEDQKKQARNNIGAGTSNLTNSNITNAIDNNCVKFNAQELTVTQKAQARENIAAGTSNVVILNTTATFTSGGWTTTAPYTQSVTITGLTADDTPIIDFDYSSATMENYTNLQDNYNKILRFTSGENSITAYCYDSAPTIDVKINIKAVK